MKRKNFMLTVAAAAVLGAFNPAFAGGGAKHGSADDVSSPPTAVQGQPGTQSGPAVESAKMNPGASADAGLSADAVSADVQHDRTPNRPAATCNSATATRSLAGSLRKRAPSAARTSTRRPASTAATLQTRGVPAVPKAGQRPLFFA